MRIVGGAFKGRTLQVPVGRDIRPTSDRTREAVFNVLAHGLADWPGELEGASVVDVFAGTGALALEALSRGAVHATIIDNHPQALAVAKKNAANLGAWRQVTLLKIDGARLAPPPLVSEAPCGVAFLDPPYGQGLALPALLGLKQRGWLAVGGLVVLEVGADEELPPQPGFAVLDERTYGAAKVVFLQTRD